MKSSISLICFAFVCFFTHSQENLKLSTVYHINKCYGSNCLIIETPIKKKIFKKGATLDAQQKLLIEGIEFSVERQLKIDKDVETEVIKAQPVMEWPVRKAAVKFEGDKLYINRYLLFDADGKDEGRNDTYYFKMKNRETISLNHTGVYLSALTIPIKYRPPLTDKEGNKIKEEFVTDFNANLFLSTTIWGKTKFTHLKNNDNSIRDHNLRFGAFLGGSTLKLNTKNTANAPSGRALEEGQEITKGLFSFGMGFTYTYNSFGVGAFLGWDQAVGSGSNIWDYDGAPWVGLSLGIDLLKIGKITQ